MCVPCNGIYRVGEPQGGPSHKKPSLFVLETVERYEAVLLEDSWSPPMEAGEAF